MAANVLTTYEGVGPHGKEEKYAMFEILDTTFPFVLTDIAVVGSDYVFSAWVSYTSEEQDTAELTVGGNSTGIGADWTRFISAFTATTEDVPIVFGSTGTYYIYHPQLELGNKATDWTPNPEDVDSDIVDAKSDANDAKTAAENANTTINAVSDGLDDLKQTALTARGTQIYQNDQAVSILTLDEELSNAINDINLANSATIDELGSRLGVIEDNPMVSQLGGYVSIDPDEPSISLGKQYPEDYTGSKYQLHITNTFAAFVDDKQPLTTITNKALQTENVEVHGDLQIGDEEKPKADGVWIWKQRANGNLGLVWKGVTS